MDHMSLSLSNNGAVAVEVERMIVISPTSAMIGDPPEGGTISDIGYRDLRGDDYNRRCNGQSRR